MQEQILLAGSTEKSRMLLQTLLPPGTNPPPRMCMSGAETRWARMTGRCLSSTRRLATKAALIWRLTPRRTRQPAY